VMKKKKGFITFSPGVNVKNMFFSIVDNDVK
jgi:hypothetical protein